MKGFIVSSNLKIESIGMLEEPLHLEYSTYKFNYSKLEKFEHDKIFTENEEYICLLDGVVFNKCDLISNENWKDTFLEGLSDSGMDYIKKLRGSFCGVVLSKKSKELVAFTNQSGEKALYYYYDKNVFILSSNVLLIKDVLKNNGIVYELNAQAAKEMLMTGSMLHGNTIINGVRRITAGKYIELNGGKVEEKRYHMFRNVPEHSISLDECIEKADELFRQAVDRVFAKNVEYGYKAEADLSGGLDSRLVSWVAHDLGYNNILNICYCQKGKIDNLTSKKIANSLGNEYFFYPMNGGDFLKDVDSVTQKTGGQVVYCLCTGANRVFDIIDTSNIGMTVTGLLGEIHNAYWVEGDAHTPPKYTNVRYTSTIKSDIPSNYADEYDNYEQMNLYEYSNLLYLSSAFVRQDRVEVYSPFIDVDYLEFAYKIPLKWRKNYLFTMSWIMKKYPEAAEYVWQTKMKPVNKEFEGKVYFPQLLYICEDIIAKIYNKICRCIHIDSRTSFKADMNNFQLWYEQNKDLRTWIDNYYKNNINCVYNEEIKDLISFLYYKNNMCRDKLLAINLISIMKEFFYEK